MKNKNRIYRAAALLLVLCFISTVMISGTFAKYTSEYSGEDTALVAKWSLDVKGGQEIDGSLTSLTPLTLLTPSGGTAANLDLFSHAFNENIVSGAGDSKIIAPGVDGSFVLSVKNNSDVAAGVTFDFTATGTGAGVPMEYRVGDTGLWVSLDNLPGKLANIENNEDDYVFELGVAEGDDSKSVEVYWRWPFEHEVSVNRSYTDGNEEDTDLGKESAKGGVVGNDGGRTGYVLTVTATATQLPLGKTGSGGSEGGDD